MHCSMNYLKSLILILFTFVCFSAHAEDETIKFTPVVAHSTEPISGNNKPDEMNYGNITISADMANFNYNSSTPYYRLFSYALLTISSESRIKKVVLYKHSSSPKPFSLDGTKNKGIKGRLTTKDSNNIVEWKCGSDNVNTISFYCTFGVTVYFRVLDMVRCIMGLSRLWFLRE